MATLRTRLDRLEGKRGGADGGPAVIFLCESGGEARAALVMGGGTLSREPDESDADFMARASQAASVAVRLPENRR